MHLDLYRKMYLIRAVEFMGMQWARQGKTTSPPHFSLGSEGLAVGVCQALRSDDLLYLHHRCHALYIAKGGRLSIYKEALCGRHTTPNATGSMHMADPEAGILGGSAIIGGALPIALGAAWGVKMAGESRRVVCAGGDSLWDTGVFWETVGVARRLQVPLLIVIEENGLSTATPAPPDGTRSIPALPTFYADGSNACAVYAQTSLALINLPAILVVRTRRYCEHVGPDWSMPMNCPHDPLEQVALTCSEKMKAEEVIDAFLRETLE
jgi:TPP-dependent pyruvate/acetoin dehydrogenase alpha subunit